MFLYFFVYLLVLLQDVDMDGESVEKKGRGRPKKNGVDAEDKVRADRQCILRV